jgi:MFS family permease
MRQSRYTVRGSPDANAAVTVGRTLLTTTRPPSVGHDVQRTDGYAWYVLAILVAVYSINWMDRYVLVILLPPIKRELHLSDGQLGLLAGFAFALVYSVAGVPIARWADRNSRRSLISFGLVIWSSATALTGLAQNFTQLIAARFGVALGESSCSPAASSLIADYFPSHRRATAFAIYGLGISIGMAMGLSIGGGISESFGWRTAVMLVGLPGLLIAVVVRFTVREPVRGAQETSATETSVQSLSATLRTMLSRKCFLAYGVGLGLVSLSGNAFETWTPTYLMRLYGMGSGTVGTLTGTVEGVGGIIGTLAGGVLSDMLGRRDERWYLWIPALTAGAMVPSMYAFLHTNGAVMLVFYSLTVVCAGAYMAPLIAVTQRLMPPQVRALATALVYLLLNLIGPGAGPLVAGLLSDALGARLGNAAIRASLTLTLMGALVGVPLILYAGRLLPGELAAAATAARSPAMRGAALESQH